MLRHSGKNKDGLFRWLPGCSAVDLHLNLQDAADRTALDLAASEGHDELASLLIEAMY